MNLAIVHEDDALLVLDKPSGLLVHRGIGRAETTLCDLVRDYTNDAPRPVHRLDRGTSGIIVFAKSSEVAAAIQRLFQDGSVTKEYVALVRGISPERGVIDSPVPKSEDGERVDALTRFERIETFPNAQPRALSLVAAFPETGRFHQIRRHLKHINHPLIGDSNYGKGKLNRACRDRYGLARLALHARSIAWVTVEGVEFSYEAAIPPDLQEPLDRMAAEN